MPTATAELPDTAAAATMEPPPPRPIASGGLREVAQRYARRGWSVIPIPYRSKNPSRRGWQQLRLREAELHDHFDDRPQNIGVLLGEPSNWLVDIDLDHPRRAALADRYLPPTPAVFGRRGNPRSHRIYRVTGPVATKKHGSKSTGMLVELRSTGTQTVFPPSTHESGEPITWEAEGAEPTEVAPDELLTAVAELANTVRVELGERQVRKTGVAAASYDGRSAPAAAGPGTPDAVERCLRAMRRVGIVDQNDGSLRLFTAACRCVEHGLDEAQALDAIRRYARENPFPTQWTDAQITQRLRDAERGCVRGTALRAPPLDEDGLIALGQRDPGSGRLVLSPKRTLPTAEAFVRQFHWHPAGRTIHRYADALYVWRDNRYVALEDEAVRQRLQPWLHAAARYYYNRRTDSAQLGPFESNPGTVNSALASIHALVHLPVETPVPSWLDRDAGGPDPREILACRSALLHLPTLRALPPTPAYFSVNALDYDHDPQAPEPTCWLAFLGQLFEDDLQSWDLIQEWFGYCLTGDTSQHKMLLIVGPRRSGKGTIARVLARLVGASNVAGPTTSSLAGPFGLQPLIGKSLAIVSDARFSGKDVQTVIERLLCVSGEDALTIDRKHMTSVTMKLPTRFVFLTNELPRLTDASGALAGRFMMLRLTESFYGREDKALTAKLLIELPGILNWAIDGWRQLRERGHCLQPSSVEDALRDMEDLSSPVGAFVRERCDVGSGLRAWIDDLYQAWKEWCEADGRVSVTTKQTFGRDLMAAVPGVSRRCGTNGVRFYQGIGLKGVLV